MDQTHPRAAVELGPDEVTAAAAGYDVALTWLEDWQGLADRLAAGLAPPELPSVYRSEVMLQALHAPRRPAGDPAMRVDTTPTPAAARRPSGLRRRLRPPDRPAGSMTRARDRHSLSGSCRPFTPGRAAS